MESPAMTGAQLVARFCAVPVLEEDAFDTKALAGSSEFEIPFSEGRLRAYSWGQGPTILLAHGWASKASHMALLARALVRAGFRAVAYDGPAHGRSRALGGDGSSSLFEFIGAFAAVAQAIGPIRAAIGHSLGGAAAAFALAGRGKPPRPPIAAEALVLISAPQDTSLMIANFCAGAGLSGYEAELEAALERAFDFRIRDFRVSDALRELTQPVLIVHDEDDEEIPPSSALIIREGKPDAELMLTRGSGHGKILANRAAMRRILEMLALSPDRSAT